MPVMGSSYGKRFRNHFDFYDFNTVKIISEHSCFYHMSEIKLTMEGRNQMEHHCINLTIGCDGRK